MRSKIDLVLFDLDNVLCDYDPRARAQHLAEVTGRTAEQVYETIWRSGFEYLGDSGDLSASVYLEGFGARLGYPLTLQEWLDARRAATRTDARMLHLVEELRQSVEVAILTNNSELVSTHIDVLFPELRPLFGQRIYASARFKAAKPDPECFHRCLATLEISPARVLFVDDLEENVAGARNAGLFAHHHTCVDTLRCALADYGLDLEG